MPRIYGRFSMLRISQFPQEGVNALCAYDTWEGHSAMHLDSVLVKWFYKTN